jgi:hypothetical protein
MNRNLVMCAVSLLLAIIAFALSASVWLAQGKERQHADAPATTQSKSAESWLQGSPDDKLKQVEKQLRGFDKTMAEVGYRFSELYFAGQDRNWEYANYQAEKIQAAIRLGLERRPKRAASAQAFLNDDLPAMVRVIKAQEPLAFTEGITNLRMACMRCHVSEKLPYFTVELPEHRLSPIRTVRQ